MSKGGLSASMGPSHLLFIIIRIEDHLMKVLIIMRNDGMECNGMEWWKPSNALLFQDYYQINLPPLFRQRCALQVVETSPVRRKAGLNSPEDWYSTCLNLFVSNFRLLQHVRVNFLIFVFDDQRHSLSLLQGWKLEKVLRYSADWTVLKDPHQQLHINMVASEITEIMKDLMDSSISKETGCCWSGILGQGYSPNNWRNVRAALSGIDHGKS